MQNNDPEFALRLRPDHLLQVTETERLLGPPSGSIDDASIQRIRLSIRRKSTRCNSIALEKPERRGVRLRAKGVRRKDQQAVEAREKA